MPNSLITPSVIASRGLATLYNNIVLASLVTRDFDKDFTGKQGDTITVRKPATFVAKEFDRDTGIELQTINESSFTVSLDTLLDVSFPVTSEELTLEIDEFARRLLDPAAKALAEDIDNRLAEALIDTAKGVGGGGSATGETEASDALNVAAGLLTKEKMPLGDRAAVIAPMGAVEVRRDEKLVKVNESGSTEGLRNASMGRLYGFDTYESQVYGSGTGDRATTDGVAFHRDAVALVARTLQAPEGVAPEQVAVESFNGLGLRVVKGYDMAKKQDIISMDVLIGVEALRPKAVVELDLISAS